MNEVIPEDPEHSDWARGPERHAERLREVAPQYGFDVSKVILGDVLRSITGDDFTCFGTPRAPFVPENAAISKKQLLIRLDLEIGTPELPGRIKRRLERVKKYLERIDWQTETGFRKAKRLWTNGVQNFVQEESTKHPEYKEAIKDASVLEKEMRFYPLK